MVISICSIAPSSCAACHLKSTPVFRGKCQHICFGVVSYEGWQTSNGAGDDHVYGIYPFPILYVLFYRVQSCPIQSYILFQSLFCRLIFIRDPTKRNVLFVLLFCEWVWVFLKENIYIYVVSPLQTRALRSNDTCHSTLLLPSPLLSSSHPVTRRDTPQAAVNVWEMSWAKHFLPVVKKRRREGEEEEDSTVAWIKKADLDRGLLTPEQVCLTNRVLGGRGYCVMGD